jgi:hypothetical protein
MWFRNEPRGGEMGTPGTSLRPEGFGLAGGVLTAERGVCVYGVFYT